MVCPAARSGTGIRIWMQRLSKEQNSTCRRSVWNTTAGDMHHEVKVPPTWWAAENTQPSVPSTHEQVAPESHSGGSSNNSTSQAMPTNLMHPWFALPLAAEKGSEYGCSDSARSRTQPAGGLFRTPPLGTYTMKSRCPRRGGLLRIHSQASPKCMPK